MRTIDVVLQATGQHSWNLARGWANAARQLGLHHRTFAPKAEWGAAEAHHDDGLFDYLRQPGAEMILLLGFDWHSQALHRSLRWQRRWQESPLIKVLYIHESIVENCRLWENDLMRQAVMSALTCVDLVVYNDLTDKELLEGLHPRVVWQPYGVDETVFTCARPYAERIPKAVFRGKATPFYTNKSYQQRREYIEFLQTHGAIELLDYDDGQEAYKVILQDYNNYRIALNFPTLGRNHPSRVPEVLACGATLLTNRTGMAENDALFEHGKQVWYYSNKEELLEGIRHLSADWETAARIADAGRQLALQRLTLAHQLKEIVSWANQVKSSPPPARRRRGASPPKPKAVLVDGVMFQIQRGRPLGISRVWTRLLNELAKTELAERIVLLDRDQTAPAFPGIRRRLIRPYEVRSFEDDPCYLQEICEEENAALFFSTYYTWPEKTRSVLLLHDMIPEMRGMDLQEFQWRAKAKAIGKALAYCVVSESTRNDFQRLYPEFARRKTYLTPNAVTEEYRQRTPAEIASFRRRHGIEKPYFLLTGMRTLYKNAIQFFKAFQLLENRHQYEIVCTGGQKELEDLFRPYVRDVRCRVLFLSDDELAAAYSGAVALAYLSHYEGFGLPVLEAQACGCPVIACRNSSIPEVSGDAVFYVPEADVPATRAALLEIQRAEVRSPLVRAGRLNSQRFSWQQTGRVLYQAVDELLRDVAGLPPVDLDPIDVPARLAYFLTKETTADPLLLQGIQQLSDLFIGRCLFDESLEREAEAHVATHLARHLEVVLGRTALLEECDSLLSYLLALALEQSRQLRPALQRYVHAIKSASYGVSIYYRLRLGLRLARLMIELGEYGHAKDTLEGIVLTLHKEHPEGLALLEQANRQLAGERAAPASAVVAAAAQSQSAPVPSTADEALPVVSALVSTYKSERFLRGCLEDLTRQTLFEQGLLEIIVIDSHSPENERAIVEEFQGRFRNIVYLRTDERETVYGAWNRGLGVARGRYLTNANTDDRHRRDALEVLARTLDERHDVTLVYADCLITQTENETFETAHPVSRYDWLEFDPQDLLEQGCFVGPQPMWRREVHQQYGTFDSNMVSAGDYEFWLRIASDRKFLHVPETLGLYLQSPNSVEHRHRDLGAREIAEARRRHGPAILSARETARVSQSSLCAKTAPAAFSACAQLGNLRKARELAGRRQWSAAWTATLDTLEQRPFHPEAWLHLAEIALAAGDSVMARRCAQRSRECAPAFQSAGRFLKRRLRGGTRPDWLTLPPAVNLDGASSNPRLTVCLIVKNEEAVLGRCLESVAQLAGQMVVVDTGSTDRTVEIARAHGAEVHTFDWCDDFAAARNAALEHARGDWVLVLDADEELPPDSAASLLTELKDPRALAYRLPIVDAGAESDGAHYVPRLFRNAPGVFFQGRIHEHAFGSLEPLWREWGLECRLGKARLLHHGYTAGALTARAKAGRNLRLLRLALDEQPDDVNLRMNLGLELTRTGQAEAGLAEYWRAFRLAERQPSVLSPELREALLTQLCTRLLGDGRAAEVLTVIESGLGRQHSLTASLHYLHGLACLELERWDGAVQAFRQCIALRAQAALTPAFAEIHGPAPEKALACCLDRTGRETEAERILRDLIQRHPESAEAVAALARFLAEHERAVEALELLHAALPQYPGETALWVTGGEIALSRVDYLEFACDWTREALKLWPDHTAILAQRAEALLLKGEADAALPLWRQAMSSGQPEPRAAVILCELCTNQLGEHALNGSGEAVAREFLRWYQRLAHYAAHRPLLEVNARLPELHAVLPLAAQALESALAEAAQP